VKRLLFQRIEGKTHVRTLTPLLGQVPGALGRIVQVH
jgi:hypothetical protein